jgi:subtilisin
MTHRLLLILLALSLVVVSVGHNKPQNAQAESEKKSIIVVLKDNGEDPEVTAKDLKNKHGLAYGHIYRSALNGFSGEVPAAKFNKIKEDPRVAFISDDKEVNIGSHNSVPTIAAQTLPTGINRIDSELNSNKGTGVGVAVIDTGIDLTHPDLKSNIVADKNCYRNNRSGNDDNGHGSHVAGTIAAKNNTSGVVGVAPEAKLVAVKVLSASGSGTWSSVICGIDWVTSNASRYNIKVANMSLGGGGTSDNNCGNTNSDALHKAICRSTAAGVTYIVAAGNSSENASYSVPASYNDTVITVSALADSDGQASGLGGDTSYGADDTFASFSNFGSVVDVAAPGVSIYSTYKSGGFATLSGTSMATPHVAGAAALYLKNNPSASWSQVRTGLINAGEALNAGHTDGSGLHSEPVLKANSL